MADTKTQPAAATTGMDFSSLSSMLTKGISEGMKLVMQSKASADSDLADHVAMLAQHAKVTGEDDKKSSSSDAAIVNELSGINTQTQTIVDMSQRASEIFSAIPEKLNMISDTVGAMRSSLEGMSATGVGSKANQEASSFTNMGQGERMPAEFGVRTAFTRMNEGAGFPQQSASVSSNMLQDSGKAAVVKKVMSVAGKLPDSGKAGIAKQALAAADSSKNTVENDRKIQLEEEDRAFKESTKPVYSKLSQALDKYLSSETSGGGGGEESGGFSLLSLLATLGGGAIGFVVGYISKLASMWGEVGKAFLSGIKAGWNKLKNSKIGKFFQSLGGKIKGAFSKGIAKIGEFGTKLTSVFSNGISKIKSLGSTFTSTLSNWKNSLKESKIGKAASKVGGFFSKMASKFKSGVTSAAKGLGSMAKKIGSKVVSGVKTAGKAIANGAKKAGSAIAKSGIAQKAIKAARVGAKIAKKFPLVQAAAGIADTVANTYKVVKAGGSVTDIMTTVGAGLVDTLSDTLMVPELINAAGNAIGAIQSGKGLGGVLAEAGKGFIQPRDANDISIGTGLMANLQNLVGNETETTRRVAAAYNSGQGYDAAGVQVVSGAAGGFGHSAALYVPPAAGSTQNANTPNAKVAEAPTAKPQSEAEKNKELANMLEESVKNAYLSQEVQEANRQNAKETGSAINTQLMG